MISHHQLLLNFGRSVLKRIRSTPDQLQSRKRSRLRPDPLLADFANQLLLSIGCRHLKVSVCWNPALRTTAGLASWTDRMVVLNPKLVEISAAEVQRTLRHELAHLLAQHTAGRRRIAAHGREWREACELLGIPNEPRCHDLPFKRRKVERKFFYACQHCGTILARVRRPSRPIACVKCCRKHNNGRYHERFRFRPTPPPSDLAA
ncbi:MAG: SprT-like domain-containing protein [Terrimicrobiaceae bacterium]|nr:SprT-like domain-containing protein [Terrimicrobiaceae bacterium]